MLYCKNSSYIIKHLGFSWHFVADFTIISNQLGRQSLRPELSVPRRFFGEKRPSRIHSTSNLAARKAAVHLTISLERSSEQHIDIYIQMRHPDVPPTTLGVERAPLDTQSLPAHPLPSTTFPGDVSTSQQRRTTAMGDSTTYYNII